MNTHKKILSMKDPFYIKQVSNYFVWQLENDLGEDNRDITTESLLSDIKKDVEAIIVSKDDGFISGLEELEWFLLKKGIEVIKFFSDGDRIKKNDTVLKLKGDIREILKYERVVLNLLQRMSGITTYTSKMVSILDSNALLCPTRKTYLGLLDKKAVLVGGGGTHRLGLYDAILVKENHISVKKLDQIIEIINNRELDVGFIEIEVENLKQLDDLLFFLFSKNIIVIMLDNFSIKDIREAITMIRPYGYKIEVSGNIGLSNIRDYTDLDIDIISSGELTHSVTSLDFSQKILV